MTGGDFNHSATVTILNTLPKINLRSSVKSAGQLIDKNHIVDIQQCS